MEELTLMRDDFASFQGQVWAWFDTLVKQIAVVDHKLDSGVPLDEPQVYPLQSSEATQSPLHA